MATANSSTQPSPLVLIQRLFMVVLLGLVFWLVFRQRQDFALALQAFTSGQWPLLIIAAALEVLFQWQRAGSFRVLYKLFGRSVDQIEILHGQLIAIMANVALPSAGLAGLHFYERLIGRRGLQTGAIVFINGLYIITDYLFLLAYFVLGLLILGLAGGLTESVLAAGLVLLALALIVIGIIVIIVLHIREIHDYVKGLLVPAKEGNFKMLVPFGAKFQESARHFLASFERLWRSKEGILPALLRLAVNHPLRMMILWLAFAEIGHPLPPAALIVAYALGVIAMALSITPLGLGATEAVMAVALYSFGISTGLAAIGVLVYRLVTFWAPFAVGVYLFRKHQAELQLEPNGGQAA